MMLLGTSGVSVEKCSCTGKISIALPTDGDCCPDEGGCMTVKSMQLSDYMPTMAASLDLPVLPVLFSVFPSVIPAETAGTPGPMEPTGHVGPPRDLAHTITVLRV